VIESYAISDRGGRAENQDRVLADHALGLFAVADLAIAALRYYVESPVDSFDVSIDGNRLVTGVGLANRHVIRRAETSPEFVGMGTTLAALPPRDVTTVAGNAGNNGTLGDPAIRAMLCQGAGVQRSAEDLLEAAMNQDASDNVSVILLGHDR
jgi:serine/threonine protein phosphatase PrpC